MLTFIYNWANNVIIKNALKILIFASIYVLKTNDISLMAMD